MTFVSETHTEVVAALLDHMLDHAEALDAGLAALLDRLRTGRRGRRFLFVSSPDHLPRVVRDALAAGGAGSLFATSDAVFSQAGRASVSIGERPHAKERPQNHDA